MLAAVVGRDGEQGDPRGGLKRMVKDLGVRSERKARRGSRRDGRSRCARLKESLEGGVGLSAGEAGERARGLRQRGERAGLGRSGCGVGAGRGAREWARGEPVGPGERRERGRSGPVLG